MFYSNCTEMQSYTMWIPSIMAKMKSWKEPKNRCWRMPMTALDVQETITAVKEAQQTVVIQLSAWLRLQSDAALERLNDARERESELGENDGSLYGAMVEKREYQKEFHRDRRAEARAAKPQVDGEAR
jgi:hypothetical protein